MNGERLVKLAPTFIMVGALAYAVYTVQSGLPGAAESRGEVEKGLDQMMQDLFVEGSGAASKLEGQLRDPFWAAVAASEAAGAAPRDLPTRAEPDTLAEFVRGLSLDATFIHGRDQIAVINGRSYSRGQRIDVPGNEATPVQSLQVLVVTRTGVILKGDGKQFSLGYPDRLGKSKPKDGESGAGGEPAAAQVDPAGQMEMFRRLLNSPLGAMGKGLIGDATSTDRRAGASARSSARRRSGTRAAGYGASGP